MFQPLPQTNVAKATAAKKAAPEKRKRGGDDEEEVEEQSRKRGAQADSGDKPQVRVPQGAKVTLTHSQRLALNTRHRVSAVFLHVR
jgi:hypothetical protein